jgi:S1-C subfamily serine protease
MTDTLLQQLSDALADAAAGSASRVVAIRTGHRHRSGILWRPDVVVTSEQVLPGQPGFTVVHAGTPIPARLAGRDTGTNVAVLRLESPVAGGGDASAEPAPLPRIGALALVLAANAEGAAAVQLGVVHSTGPEWHSMAGGRIDAFLRLDAQLGGDEGGPVLDAAGRLLGMSTTGPRRRALVIPTATIARVIDPLLVEGRIARGWLGVGLQPVTVPESLRAAAERDSGMMVTSLAPGAPAEQAGVLPGDILLDVDGIHARRARALAAALGPERVGQALTLRLLRAGAVHSLTATVAARPA